MKAPKGAFLWLGSNARSPIAPVHNWNAGLCSCASVLGHCDDGCFFPNGLGSDGHGLCLSRTTQK